MNLPKHQPLRNAISAGTTDFDGVLPIYEKTQDQFDMIMDSLKVEFYSITKFIYVDHIIWTILYGSYNLDNVGIT